LELLTHGTQAGTACRHRESLGHGELLPDQGHRNMVDPPMEYIPLQEFALQVLQPC
jgi:hypothetical protein